MQDFQRILSDGTFLLDELVVSGKILGEEAVIPQENEDWPKEIYVGRKEGGRLVACRTICPLAVTETPFVVYRKEDPDA